MYLIQLFAGKVNSILENKLLKMFCHADTLFIKSMCKAVFEWDGNLMPNCHVAHIHGARDTVIFPPPAGAEILQDGGHLIAISHEATVAEFIKVHINT